MKGAALWFCLACALLIGCRSTTFESPQKLGGKTVAAEVLNRGEDVFKRHCTRCHGSRGNGLTTAMRSKYPPRDLTLGVYKFSSVRAGQLPVDADLKKTIVKGLGDGRVMPSFGHLDEADLTAVVQYLKTLSSRWREETPGVVVPVLPDPWTGNMSAAIRRGDEVYHLQAKCWTCHPSYRGSEQLEKALRSLGDASEVRATVHQSEPVQSVFGPMNPPDFRKDTLLGGWENARLFTTISAGVSGTAMPTWADSLSAKDRWALVHYVRQLDSGTRDSSAVGANPAR